MDIWTSVFSIIEDIINNASPFQNALYKALIAVVGFCVIYLILKKLLVLLEKRLMKMEIFQAIDQSVFKLLHKIFLYLLILLTGAYLIRLFNLKVIEALFFAILIILLAFPVKSFLVIIIELLKSNVAQKTSTKLDDIVFDLLSKFAGVLIYCSAVVMALDVLGINIMPFVAGAGVAGIAIGFAAKDTLSNLIAGVLLIIDRPFEIGDRIEVWNAPSGSATWGDVIDIGLRATKIRTTDNIVVIIPNNEVMKRDILNYTLNSPRIRVRVNIGIAYDADIAKAKKIITDIASSLEWAITNPAPKVVVRNFGESSVDLQLRIWINNARKRMDTISIITDKVKADFDKEGIEIPFPRRDIVIREKIRE